MWVKFAPHLLNQGICKSNHFLLKIILLRKNEAITTQILVPTLANFGGFRFQTAESTLVNIQSGASFTRSTETKVMYFSTVILEHLIPFPSIAIFLQ